MVINYMVIKKLQKFTSEIVERVLAVILSAMLILTFVQVTLRYVFNSPIAWSEEVTLVMLIWYGFLAMALGVKDDSHMSLEFFYVTFSEKGKKVLDLIRHILMLVFSILMTSYAVKLTRTSITKYLPASNISRSILYIAMLISGVLMVIYTLVHLINIYTDPKESGGTK